MTENTSEHPDLVDTKPRTPSAPVKVRSTRPEPTKLKIETSTDISPAPAGAARAASRLEAKKADPVFNEKKPFVQVRDRALPHVAYQQGDALFNRKKEFVLRTDLEINVPEPPKPEVKIREIKTREVRGNKSVVGRAKAPTGNPAKERTGSPYERHNARNGVDQTLRQNARENAGARAAENLA